MKQRIKCFFGFHKWTRTKYSTPVVTNMGVVRGEWVSYKCDHCPRCEYHFLSR